MAERTQSLGELLDRAATRNAELGHENLGSLSRERGFLPAADPALRLPESHAAWDDAAALLPGLYAGLGLRAHLDRLPDLDAAALPDEHLLRAATVLGLLTHAYHRVQPSRPATTPPRLEHAWAVVNERLGRPEPLLGYGDLILTNWKNLGGADLRVESMDLLVPTVGNEEERVFYLTQVEMHAVGAPVVDLCARIEGAIRAGDRRSLTGLLDAVADVLTTLIRRSLPKIHPAAAARTYVDPGVWAKTVAPLAVPIRAGVLGPSGTSSPLFHTLDALFGRRRYDSVLGHESLRLRAIFPPHQREYVAAVAALGLPGYVEKVGDAELGAAYATAAELYAGPDGILERHRLKVAGYLEMAFKLGRSVTIGGFSGRFSDRTWREVDQQLVASRDDRATPPARTHRARVVRVGSASAVADARVRQVVLDTSGTGLRHAPGDRCLIHPEQDPGLVDRTLRALGATGHEPIRLDAAWQERMELLDEPGSALEVAELLRRGELRPVSRATAKTLLGLCASESLERIVEARAEDQWELPDLLELLACRGWDPAVLLAGEPGDQTSLCRIVPPVVPRVYSVSSDAAQHPDQLHLTVGALDYLAGDGTSPMHGTGSGFLTRGDPGREVVLGVRRSAAFAPPADPARPVVLVAGGSGLAPFRAFLWHRFHARAPGECLLFLGVRDPSELPYPDELERLTERLPLTVHVALSREGQRRRVGDLMTRPDVSDALWRLARDHEEGGDGAVLYVCGSADFAAGVDRSLREVFRRYGDRPERADRRFREMVADRRYVAEVFTSYTGPQARIGRQVDASELAEHAGGSPRPWIAVRGRVYDMTEFRALHPGGHTLIDGYAGTDATAAYEHVEHHRHAEVDAVLSMYEIGAVRRLDLGRAWGTMVGADGLEVVELADLFKAWVRLLYLAIEMHTAARIDATIRHKKLTRASAAGQCTPYALQFCIEAHDRFVLNNRELVDEPLSRLWAMVTGVCDQRRDVRELPERIAAVLASEEALAAGRAGEHLYDALQRYVDAADPEGLAALDGMVAAVADADAWLRERLEAVLRDGIRLIETHEAAAVEVAGDRLVESLVVVPAILREHAERVNTATADPPAR